MVVCSVRWCVASSRVWSIAMVGFHLTSACAHGPCSPLLTLTDARSIGQKMVARMAGAKGDIDAAGRLLRKGQ